jgi:hypothetical protein
VLDDDSTDAVVGCVRTIGTETEPSATMAAHRFTPTRAAAIRRTSGGRSR